jgi:hypothetical protein
VTIGVHGFVVLLPPITATAKPFLRYPTGGEMVSYGFQQFQVKESEPFKIAASTAFSPNPTSLGFHNAFIAMRPIRFTDGYLCY